MSECCPVIRKIGDDFEDNTCTFHCQLPEGHSGRHEEKWLDCVMSWAQDDREKCEKCGKLVEELHLFKPDKNRDKRLHLCNICLIEVAEAQKGKEKV